MEIFLIKANLEDAEIVHGMLIKSFTPLLEKYQDYDTSPATEPIENTITKITRLNSDYYIIKSGEIDVGGVRIEKMKDKHYRVSPIFILPEYQGKKIAQRAFQILEHIYSDANWWELDTILQEQGNCHLYEKIGYKRTGKTKIINDKLTIVFYEKLI